MAGPVPLSLRPEHPAARSLSQLISDFALDYSGDIDDREVTGVAVNSASVEPGDLYVGVQGKFHHGALFASTAEERGAIAIVTDEAGAALVVGTRLPIILVQNPRNALGAIASWIYRTDENPADLFGVTGTNGKTSVVYIVQSILSQLGVVAALSSTAERRIASMVAVSSLTTPEATELHAFLARGREEGARAAVIEVSAQALTQHRVDGLIFDVVGFTNLTHDHLDDYTAMNSYFEAKLKLFQPDRARRGVVIIDSAWGQRMAAESRIPVTTLSVSGGGDADWSMTVLEETITYTEFELTGPDGRRIRTRIPLIGWYMAANSALAIVMLVESGYDLGAIGQALERDGGIMAFVPGRTERISGERGPIVFVDYAHSPDAFASALGAIRKVNDGRIVMLFGADGDRDTTKRVEMAAIAARGSDVVVVTDFHPRTEDPASIRATLVDAARAAVPGVELYEIADQRAAFRHALSLAVEGDVILYAGPGHETYQEVAGKKIPYSARDDARLALHEAGWL